VAKLLLADPTEIYIINDPEHPRPRYEVQEMMGAPAKKCQGMEEFKTIITHLNAFC
jgi:hypothetical protein